MKKFFKNYWAIFIPLLVLIVATIFLIKNTSKNKFKENAMIGMVDADFVDVSASLPGRLAQLNVAVGDEVSEGEVLAVMKTDEIETVRNQMNNAVNIAQNRLDLIDRGVAPEVLKSAQNIQNIAAQQVSLMNKTYQRFQQLYDEGVVSGQERDVVYFKYRAAQKEFEIAKLNAELLEKGSNNEMKEIAKSVLNQAQSAEKIASQVKESAEIKAPVSGVVTSLISNQGEMLNAGYPMMSIRKKNSFFVKFNIRQDQMSKITLHKTVDLIIPGCIPENIKGKVTEIAPALGYANWIPESQSGEFELRTFEIKITPLSSNINGLRTGMTAKLEL